MVTINQHNLISEASKESIPGYPQCSSFISPRVSDGMNTSGIVMLSQVTIAKKTDDNKNEIAIQIILKLPMLNVGNVHQ